MIKIVVFFLFSIPTFAWASPNLQLICDDDGVVLKELTHLQVAVTPNSVLSEGLYIHLNRAPDGKISAALMDALFDKGAAKCRVDAADQPMILQCPGDEQPRLVLRGLEI